MSTNEPDYPLGYLEAQLLAKGWLKVSRGADIVLLDGRDGADVASLRPGRCHRILVVSDGADPAPALESGVADDVIVLGDPHALRIRLLVAARAIDTRRRAASLVAQVRRWSVVDPLTGLGNRRALAPELGSLLRRVRAGVPCAVLIADIDHFKAVNDTYGHLVGDRLLAEVAARIAGVLRDDGDQAFRFGGEEFVVLVPGRTAADAVTIAERLRAAVGGLTIGSTAARVTISVGLVALPAGSDAAADAALRAADEALYEAKRGGRDRVCVGVLATRATEGIDEDPQAARN